MTGPGFPGAAAWLPAERTWQALQQAVQVCQGCELYRNATQAVMGQGAGDAPLMLIGEQPGDREDVSGAPFVGPAGRLLDEALEAAAINPEAVYRTKAVKHFRFRPRASGPSTSRRRVGTSQRVSPGSLPSSENYARVSSRCSERPPGNPCSVPPSASAQPAVRWFPGRSTGSRSPRPRQPCWPPSTPRRCCARATETRTSPPWSPTCT